MTLEEKSQKKEKFKETIEKLYTKIEKVITLIKEKFL